MRTETWRFTARHADGHYGETTVRVAATASALGPVAQAALNRKYRKRGTDWTLLTATEH